MFVGSLVAVAVLTGTYSIVAGAIEDGGHDVLFEAGGTESFLDGASSVREMPNRAARHNHVARGGANGSRE